MYNIIKLFIFIIFKKPVLLLPGFGASKLIKNNIEIWPPNLSFFLFNHDIWTNHMMDKKEVYTLEFGDKKSLDMNSLLLTNKNFYKKILLNDNIYPIPYDFRQINNDIYMKNLFIKLKIYIENFNKPIIILTHSTGGLIMHYFLTTQSKNWLDKHIDKIIHVNVPFGGIIYTLDNLIRPTFINKLFSKKLLLSIDAYIINLPNQNIIKPTLVINNQIANYYKIFDIPNDILFILANSKIIKSLDKKTHINTKIIYTSNIKTPIYIKISNNNIDMIYGLGDGLVPLSSLLYPIRWKQSNLEIINLQNYEHSSILLSDELINIIDK